MKKNKKFYVYILRCSDNSLYTGWTTNLKRRLKEHKEGKGAKYTRGRTPLDLVYYEIFNSRSEAQKRECEIKNYSKTTKEILIN
ncbi:MAG TPA: GIY-YIG nuclease family protein [Candidatus Mcinerneyibacterium sp.]|nr:GIY-YIG nuclease family protein [Candidatus Mcinerneyibacterium sp.]